MSKREPVEVIIRVDANGIVTVQGPIQDKIWMYGLLEIARQSVQEYQAPVPKLWTPTVQTEDKSFDEFYGLDKPNTNRKRDVFDPPKGEAMTFMEITQQRIVSSRLPEWPEGVTLNLHITESGMVGPWVKLHDPVVGDVDVLLLDLLKDRTTQYVPV